MAFHYPQEEFFLNTTAEEIAESIAPCGFVCGMCYNTVSDSCPGCQNEDEACPIRACCAARGIRGCMCCPDFPCCECNFRGVRLRAFLRCAKEEGILALAGYLLRNARDGIHYHCGDTYVGDYDKCVTEQQVLELLHNGRRGEKNEEKETVGSGAV